MAETARAGEGGRYALVAIVLHWTIAALIILQLTLATRVDGLTPEAFAVTQLHKSVGITILLLSLARLAWRLTHRPPPEPATLAPWERNLAAVVHWAFYGLIILTPLTGWIMVSTGRIVLPTLLYGTIPWPHVPGLAELSGPTREAWHDSVQVIHHLLGGRLAYLLIALHVAGALKHQLFRRDEPVLARMAPGAVAGRWLEPRLLAILAAVAGIVTFGLLYDPPRPAMGAVPQATAKEPYVARPEAAVEAPAGTVPTPEPAGAVKWTVLPGSTLGFITAWSGQDIRGRFDRWTADIVFSPDDLDNSRVTVAIDMASANTGDAQRDQTLPASDWFDTASHPKATFTATRFDVVGENRYAARGTLTLRGISRPLTLPFRLTIDGDTATVSGVTSMDRTAFGVGQGEWTNTDQIPGQVTVRVNLKARRASP